MLLSSWDGHICLFYIMIYAENIIFPGYPSMTSQPTLTVLQSRLDRSIILFFGYSDVKDTVHDPGGIRFDMLHMATMSIRLM